MKIDGVKVFSTNRPSDREFIGGWITSWLRRQPDDLEVVDARVLQSSSSSNHCLTIVLLYRRRTTP